jgi:hypothetical protein
MASICTDGGEVATDFYDAQYHLNLQPRQSVRSLTYPLGRHVDSPMELDTVAPYADGLPFKVCAMPPLGEVMGKTQGLVSS